MKKILALITGGNSSEVEISIKSAHQIASQLDPKKYETFVITISGSDWYYQDKQLGKIPIDKNDFSLTISNRHILFDQVLVMIHGRPAEDGRIQGYFEMLGIPYTCCGVLASAITFNKHFSKNYLAHFGITSAPALLFRKGADPDIARIKTEIGFPCFVKPNNEGSSFGITKVMHEEELDKAFDKAFAKDKELLVEKYIEGTEVTCGMMKLNGKYWLFPLAEIVSKKEFFDYEAKYTPGMADEIIPARISAELTKECHSLSSRIYDILNCQGIVRIDYILRDGTFYFLEVNTIPGMSENSIVPRQIKAMGYTVAAILDEIFRNP